MKCPKCKKDISPEAYDCPYCGTSLRTPDNSKKKKGLRDRKRKKDKNINVKFANDDAIAVKKRRTAAVKIGIFAAIAAVAVIIVVVIVMALTASKGERYADDAAQYIGKTLEELSEGTELHYTDESKYYGVNSAVPFDYVYESDKSVKAQGIAYPRWAVFVNISDMGSHISEVTYTDFTVVKRDIRGKKRGGNIDLGRFSSGAKQSAVLKEIDMSPYSITYSENGGITYVYKYYYERDNGDEQAMLLRVTFSEKGNYKYSTSEVLIPQNM